MRKRMLLGVMGIVLAFGMTGCGASESGDGFVVEEETVEKIGMVQTGSTHQHKTDSDATSESRQENVGENTQGYEAGGQGVVDNSADDEGSQGGGRDTQISKDLTFADLSKLQFEFSSGAGAWAEQFTIEKDGYFTGTFYDADMGDTGEGYGDGTYYVSAYSGHFTNLTKIDTYTYEMTLADITYANTPGMVNIRDNQRTFYTNTNCLGDEEVFTIYLPGTSLEKLTEDVKNWIFLMNESETELSMTVIENKENGCGIYSYDRLNALEAAQLNYNTYEESYEYYGQKLAMAETTQDMVEYSAIMYEYSDHCLNYIWNLIRYNVEEDKYQEILREQRKWIQEKEDCAKEAAAEFEGGSFAQVAYNEVLAGMTIERCAQLVEYLR